jgi:hypothetical protein
MTFGTVIVEAFFPLAVWFRPTRRLAIITIAGLHLGIAVMIPNVTHFTLSMICTFASFLVAEDMDALQRIVSNSRSWLKRTLSASTTENAASSVRPSASR